FPNAEPPEKQEPVLTERPDPLRPQDLLRRLLPCYSRRNRGSRMQGSRSMSTANTILEVNRELARKINEEARANPQSPYANKFVGIVNGQVVVVADTLEEMIRHLRQVEPDPMK